MATDDGEHIVTGDEVYAQALAAEERGATSEAAKLYERAEDLRKAETDQKLEDLRAVFVQASETMYAVAEVLVEHALPGGGGLTCTEANALVALYRALCLDECADALEEAHASSDEDESDEHHARYLEIRAEEAAGNSHG